MFGYSPKKINTTIIPIILGHAPAGCSLKQAYHYLQAAKSGIKIALINIIFIKFYFVKLYIF